MTDSHYKICNYPGLTPGFLFVAHESKSRAWRMMGMPPVWDYYQMFAQKWGRGNLRVYGYTVYGHSQYLLSLFAISKCLMTSR